MKEQLFKISLLKNEWLCEKNFDSTGGECRGGREKNREEGNWEQKDSPNPQCKHEAAPQQQKQDASVWWAVRQITPSAIFFLLFEQGAVKHRKACRIQHGLWGRSTMSSSSLQADSDVRRHLDALRHAGGFKRKYPWEPLLPDALGRHFV